MELSYKGFVEIGDLALPYVFENYALTIVASTKPYVGWDTIRSVVSNGWICLKTMNSIKLCIKVAEEDYTGYGEFTFRAVAYLKVLYGFPDKDFEQDLKIQSMLIRHEVIDCMFKHCDILEDVIKLAEAWKDSNPRENIWDIDVPDEEKIKLCMAGKNYEVAFSMLSHYDYFKTFPFEFFHALFVNAEEDMTLEDIYCVANNVKMFLSLISNTRVIDLKDIQLLHVGEKEPVSAEFQ